MATTEISAKNRLRYARARTRGQERVEDSSAIDVARYDSDADAIVLAFKCGGSMSIPRVIVPGLERASASKLEGVIVSRLAMRCRGLRSMSTSTFRGSSSAPLALAYSPHRRRIAHSPTFGDQHGGIRVHR